MDTRENEEFTAHLRNAVREAERLKYKPTRFKAMLEEYGGFDAVNRILANGKPSDGFTRLWELNRIDLSCEAIIVETKWRRFFDPLLVAGAEKLLRGSRYSFKPYSSETGQAASSSGHIDPVPPAHAERERVVEGFESTASDMRINAFFRDVLRAPVANGRWSWGAVDERTRRIFLRLWRMDVGKLGEQDVIRVLGQLRTHRPGSVERQRHLDLIKSGYTAFAVLCDKDNPESGVIRDFDRDRILRLGRVVEQDGSEFMTVAESIPITAVSIADPPAVDADLQELIQAPVIETTRAALIDARLGQGRFRRELMRRWGGACAVTGCKVGAVLRASHCKPWRSSDHCERLDSNNGLVLSANLDALFDAGLISFDHAGDMLVSRVLAVEERRALGLPARLLRVPGARLAVYLAYHRDHVFLDT